MDIVESKFNLKSLLIAIGFSIIIVGGSFLLFSGESLNNFSDAIWNSFVKFFPAITAAIAFPVGMQYERYRRHKENISSSQSVINMADQDAEKLELQLRRVMSDLKKKISKKSIEIEIDAPPADAFIQDVKMMSRLGDDAFGQIGDITRLLDRGRIDYLDAMSLATDRKKTARVLTATEIKKWKSAQKTYKEIGEKLESLRSTLDGQHRRLAVQK